MSWRGGVNMVKANFNEYGNDSKKFKWSSVLNPRTASGCVGERTINIQFTESEFAEIVHSQKWHDDVLNKSESVARIYKVLTGSELVRESKTRATEATPQMAVADTSIQLDAGMLERVRNALAETSEQVVRKQLSDALFSQAHIDAYILSACKPVTKANPFL